jgi:hypothetical protein
MSVLVVVAIIAWMVYAGFTVYMIFDHITFWKNK